MPPPRQGDRKKPPSKPKPQRRQPAQQPSRKANPPTNQEDTEPSPIDLSTSIPLPLQQLLLDVFKTALLPQPSTSTPTTTISTDQDSTSHPEPDPEPTPAPLDIKALVQTIKSHLYQRDFDSAFTDAEEELLRVYALRWSAARALGYAGIFKAVLAWMNGEHETAGQGDIFSEGVLKPDTRAVCIGGGAGAEIVALAAAWRDLEGGLDVDRLGRDVKGVSLDENGGDDKDESRVSGSTATTSPRLHVAAVDIADWSSVVEWLSRTMVSTDVPAPRTSRYQPPLVLSSNAGGESGRRDISVSFHRSDVLSISESELKDLLLDTEKTTSSSSSKAPPSLLVTLMFTLNELFSTSMAKTTSLLLRVTDILPPGATLLVVDSPGSYSTLKLGKGKEKDSAAQERKYPMKFLLDHTLLSVAEGKWERVLTQDSRWWRRDAARLRYEVGEGAGLEDMRFQVHLYRRLES